MAILHRATLTPSKLEIVGGHAARFPSLVDADRAAFALIGAYRFDDPAGKVGIESHLLATGSGPVVHVPLTYREAALAGAERWLVGTMEHSVLGTRWIYDACADPVYVQELLRVILTGDTHVEQFVATDDGPVARPSTATAAGSGAPGADVPLVESLGVDFDGHCTVITAGGRELVVRHVLDEFTAAGGPTLTGTWPGRDEPTVLAHVRA